MKSNITLKLEISLIREARILAAEEGTSISALLASRLEQIVNERKTYNREIVVNTPTSVTQALDIEVRYEISFWDALILQAAESSGAAVLYSEDLSAGQKYGPVHVNNPLTA